MSATGRSPVRHPDDFYQTPTSVVDSLLRHVPQLHDRRVLVPGCGKGAILDAIEDSGLRPGCRLLGIELNHYRARVARRRHEVRRADFLVTTWWMGVDEIVMNPPYKLAREFVEEALASAEQAGGSVHALLRLGFLASLKRREFWHQHPADVLVLPQRPSFCYTFTCKRCGLKHRRPTGTATSRCPKCSQKMDRTTTDAADYGWFSWGPGPRGRITIA